MNRAEFEIKITLVAPFYFPGTSSGILGLDGFMLRDVQNRPLIPQDQVRGIVRHGLVAIGHENFAIRFFGKKSADAAPVQHGSDSVNLFDKFTPDRGYIFFADLCATDLISQDRGKFHRVKIEDESGAAAPGQLMTVEQVALPGEMVDFTGSVIAWCVAADTEVLRARIETALRVEQSIGAMKSIGFGRIAKVSVSDCTPSDLPLGRTGAKDLTTYDRLRMRFELDRPYLVDAERVSENSFRGRQTIPGAALKGVLARVLNLRNGSISADLNQAISDLRVSFARPVVRPEQKTGSAAPEEVDLAADAPCDTVPASVVWDKDRGGFVDLSAPDGHCVEAERQVDWKQDIQDKAAKFWPQDRPQDYDERVHTEIDARRGTALDNKLFSQISVHVPAEGFEATLDFSEVDVGSRTELLDAMFGPLDGLGRTGASIINARFDRVPETRVRVEAGVVRLVLTSPGLLADYTDSDEGAYAAFVNFWKRILPQSTLLSQFSRQRLAGGYQALRFRVVSNSYRPWLLTESGAVFVFDLSDSDVAKVERILRQGLNRDALGDVSLSWENCPFVAHNGFGAFALHHPIAWRPV